MFTDLVPEKKLRTIGEHLGNCGLPDENNHKYEEKEPTITLSTVCCEKSHPVPMTTLENPCTFNLAQPK